MEEGPLGPHLSATQHPYPDLQIHIDEAVKSTIDNMIPEIVAQLSSQIYPPVYDTTASAHPHHVHTNPQ